MVKTNQKIVIFFLNLILNCNIEGTFIQNVKNCEQESHIPSYTA